MLGSPFIPGVLQINPLIGEGNEGAFKDMISTRAGIIIMDVPEAVPTLRP